jgi:hypothetical protein
MSSDALNRKPIWLEYRLVISSIRLKILGSQAFFVFGQRGSFTTGSLNIGGISADTLNNPLAMKIDKFANLYIVDNGNHRILGF